MTDAQTYFDYLRGRSFKGGLYRRFFLYPRLCRHLKGRALDIGCGLGDMLAFRPNTVGVDINDKTVAWCCQRGLEAYVMAPDVLPFEDSSFDSVSLDNVLEHLTAPAALLAEIRRVLKPNGRFLVGVPGRKGFASDPDHKIFYDEAGLLAAVFPAGFEKKKIFRTPLPFPWLDKRMRQFCLYGVFEKAS